MDRTGGRRTARRHAANRRPNRAALAGRRRSCSGLGHHSLTEDRKWHSVSRSAFPYVRPQPDTVRADVWMLKTGDELREAPPYLDGWDYNTELNLTREIQADVETIR